MVMLVTLNQASDQLRRDDCEDDGDLTLKIQAASQAVINYLKDGADFLDSDGEPEVDVNGEPMNVPANVQLAVLMLVGIMYRDRDGQEMEKWDLGYLPKPVVNLLYMNRSPAMA